MARADGGVRDLDGVRAAFASDDCADGRASRPRRRARRRATRISRDVDAPTRTRRVRAVSSRIGGDATANARGWRTSGRGDGVGAHARVDVFGVGGEARVSRVSARMGK